MEAALKNNYNKIPSGSHKFPTIFTELFITHVHGQPGSEEASETTSNASCYCDWSKKDVWASEICLCNDPNHCSCKAYLGPCPKTTRYDPTLFKEPTPYLMYSIQRGDDAGTRFIFMGKMAQEAHEETNRLNNNQKDAKVLWRYIEEEKFNSRAISDYNEFKNYNETLGE